MQQVALGKAMQNSSWISDDDTLDPDILPELPGYHDISYLTTVGRVLKIGNLAYKDKEKFPAGAWCKEDDYICYGKHAGQKLFYKGIKLLLLFDDQIIMKVEDPTHLDPTFNLTNM